jgi:4-carboxymuconolactone decarboxylase
VANEIDERMARGLATAVKLFTPAEGGPPKMPSNTYPKEIAEDWNKLSISTVMGDVWGREALAPRERAMMTIAMLTALDKPEQLKSYVSAGLNLGLSRAEVCEVVMHVAPYAGFPAAIQGFSVVNEVFEALDAEADE